MLENQPPGTVVLRVQAHDADTGVNGEVKYGIMQRDGASPGFIINPDTGKSFNWNLKSVKLLQNNTVLAAIHRRCCLMY